MTEPSNKAEFQEQLQQSWSELQRTLDGFSEEQMTERRDDVGWTVKDHLAHLISWEKGIIALLRREPRWEAMGLDADQGRARTKTEDDVNQIMRDRMEGLSLAEVRERLRAANDELGSLVESMEPEELQKGYSHFAPEEPGKETGAPVLGWVDGNSSAHYSEHLPWIREIAASGD